MKSLGIALALAVLLTHYGYMLLPNLRAQQWAFYVAQGVESAGLLALVGAAIATWGRAGRWRRLALAACVWGMLEQAQVAACGIAAYLRPIEPARWDGLCGAFTGLPLAAIGLVVALLWLAAHLQPDQQRGPPNADR